MKCNALHPKQVAPAFELDLEYRTAQKAAPAILLPLLTRLVPTVMGNLKDQCYRLLKWKLSTFLVFVAAMLIFSGCQETVISDAEPEVERKKIKSKNAATGRAATDLAVLSVSASSSLWSHSALMDDNINTLWSSHVRGSANVTEWIAYWFSADQASAHQVNYVKLRPRYEGSDAAQGFPTQFNIYASVNGAWALQATYTSFPKPQGEWIILPLQSAVSATGILINATQLGQDNYGNHVFQLAEATAGYDAAFGNFKFVGNQNTHRENEIRNVGADNFNPNKLSNWNYDYRYPLIAANSGTRRNIYAPNIVDNGAWNIYFGGWDGQSDMHDRISITVSADNFLTFNPHHVMIDNGVMNHVNNETVIKRPDGSWLMYYTTLPNSSTLNKPCYATSSNGVNWTPNAGNSSYALNMSGYANWNNADVNGSNVVYYENGTYHLYFDDFNSTANGHAWAVHHATSTDMVNFTYTGDALNEFLIAQDVRKFTYNNSNYYLMAMHLNTSTLRYSVGTSPTNFAASKLLLSNFGDGDRYITSAGFVVRDNRLLGVLYGAGPVASLDQNAIYAKWLQKKVIFISDRTGTRWGDIEKAYGPDRIRLFMNTDIETGRFYVYDTDGTTLLHTSPQVTMRSGDIWQYN